MIIPFTQLSPDALGGLIEEFVSRDGTDYGVQEVSIESKVEQVKRQLTRGEVVVVFDAESESASIMTQKQFEQSERDLLAGRTSEQEWFESGSSVEPNDMNQDQSGYDDFNQDF